ncbi:MAG: ubiquinol-cytochrome c reductase iron-sulfur subunit [Bythopirellula sp.]
MADNRQKETSTGAQAAADRRSFFAILTGGLAMLAPIGAGVWAFLSPLFRKADSPQVRVALLEQVPDDGKPYFFPVVTDRQDAWTHYQAQKVGAVYLMRQPGEEQLVAFTAKCPHAGCAVGYSVEEEKFKCPCHTSAFNLDGSRVNGDDEVAPRDMDTLAVELNPIDVGDGQSVTEVLVTFVDYKTGHSEKIVSE